jgi:hypothetical protein
VPDTFIKIASVTVGSGGAASIDFTSIPADYTDLVLKISSRTNRASAADALGIRYNSDTTFARYSGKVLQSNGSTPASTSANPANDEDLFTSGNSATASTFGNAEIYIPNYAGSNQKSASIDAVGETNATNIFMNIAATLYNQTTAISSITLVPITGNLIQQYSTATLYGIKNS